MTSRSTHQIKISLTDHQLNLAAAEAERTGKPRALILREWAFSSSSIPKGSSVYSDAVEAAARAYSGIPRTTMESIVSAVIISLNSHADS